jgi:type I restriction enzyme S subunit
MKNSPQKIGDLCNLVGGSQPEKSTFISEPKEGYVRLIQTRDYKTDSYKTYIKASATKKYCSDKDVMIGRYGPPVFQILRGLSGAYNVALMKANPKPNVSQEFLYYVLTQSKLFEYIEHLSKRTGGQTGIDVDALKNYPILAPVNETEQFKLVETLYLVDQKISLNNQINSELEAMAKSVYDYWFVQFDFPDENGKPYKSSGGKIVWCDQLKIEIPDGWETGSLSDFGKIVGGSTPFKENEANFAAEGIPWITPNDLSNNVGNNFISRGQTDVSEAGRKAASLKLLPVGAVLLSSRAPIGYMAIARNPVTTNQGFKSFVPTDRFPTSFIFFAVKRLMPAILRNANGSTFKEISGGTLGLVKTSLPDETVVKEFCKKVQPMLDMQDTLETQNKELANLRDWLLPMLMNGQVTVGD